MSKKQDVVFKDSKGREWDKDSLKQVVEALNKKYRSQNSLDYYFKEELDF